MHSPKHLIEEARALKLDGLYPEVRDILRNLMGNLAVAADELNSKADQVAGLPAAFEIRVHELEELAQRHNELYAIHQAMRVRADNEHAEIDRKTGVNRALIDELAGHVGALLDDRKAPAGPVADVTGAALKTDHKTVGGTVAAIAAGLNSTNARINEQTAKINEILAALRARGDISS